MNPFVTGSRSADLVLLLVLAALMLGLLGRMRVYYEVPKWAVERAAEGAADSQDPPP